VPFEPFNRRDFITLFGSAAASRPLAVRAQQPQAIPVVGFFRNTPPDARLAAAFRRRPSGIGVERRYLHPGAEIPKMTPEHRP
jgi:hypothetical protein